MPMVSGGEYFPLENPGDSPAFFPEHISSPSSKDLESLLNELPPFENMQVNSQASTTVTNPEISIEAQVDVGYKTGPGGTGRENIAGAALALSFINLEGVTLQIISGKPDVATYFDSLSQGFDRSDVMHIVGDETNRMSYNDRARWIGKVLRVMNEPPDSPIGAEEYKNLLAKDNYPDFPPQTTVLRSGGCAISNGRQYAVITVRRKWMTSADATKPLAVDSCVMARDGNAQYEYSRYENNYGIYVETNAYRFHLQDTDTEPAITLLKPRLAMDSEALKQLALLYTSSNQQIFDNMFSRMASIAYLAKLYEDDLVVI